MSSLIRDISLAAAGEKKIEWASRNMPILNEIREEFARTRPFEGVNITLSIHLEAKTAYLCRVLEAGGANLAITGSNPLSTQDDVAAALAAGGLKVYAWHGATTEEYFDHLRRALEFGPNIIIDDGGDLVNLVHTEMQELIPNVIGGCEETTTGVMRLISMEREGTLKFPMMLVNDADCKHLFDNRYGTGQSVWDGINRTTNLIVAGKNVVIAGYGWCGKGAAMRAKGLGARVIVTEIDPVRAIEAVMDGFTVMPMDEAAKIGDFFITVTGCCDVVARRHFDSLKNGAILANAGHFDVEVDVKGLAEYAVTVTEEKPNITGYTLPNGNTVYVLGEGRLVNLAAGDGHPAEIMDMSFAIQALGAKYLVDHRDELKAGTVTIPAEIDIDVARRKLASMGCRIDALTPEQEAYVNAH